MPPINQIIELICLLAAALLVNQKQAGFWRGFIFFLVIIVSADAIGYVLDVHFSINSNWLLNIIMLIKAFYFAFIFSKIFSPDFETKIWILCGISLFVLLFGWETFSVGFLDYHQISHTFLSILLITTSVGYFNLLLKQNEYIDILYHPPFWFVTGIFFFYLGNMTCSFFLDNSMDMYVFSKISLRSFIDYVLTMVMYCCWLFAFVCRYRQTLIYS